MISRLTNKGLNILKKAIKTPTTLGNTRLLRFPITKYHFSEKVNQNGSNVDLNSEIYQSLEYQEVAFTNIELTEEGIIDKLKNVIGNNTVVVFIKGTGENPQCGYSKFIIELLKFYQVTPVCYLNVIQNELVRKSGNLHIKNSLLQFLCISKYVAL